MTRGILLLLLMLTHGLHAQKTSILFITNNSSPISHSNVSSSVFIENDIKRDSIDPLIISRIGFCTFLNNDTTHYSILKRTLTQIGAIPSQIYPFTDYEKLENPFSRPNMDVLEKHITSEYDYTVCLNKVDFIKNMGVSKIRFWFSIYDRSKTEIISSKLSCAADLKQNMNWQALIQVLQSPCEVFEERLLTAIDYHSAGILAASSSITKPNSGWSEGRLVLFSNDTLYGELKYSDLYTVHYRLSNESPYKTLEAKKVKSYTCISGTYKTIFIEHLGNMGKHVFGRSITEGKLCLYKLREDETSRYYLIDPASLAQQRVRLTPDKKRITNKRNIAPYFADRPDIAIKLDDAKIGAKDLEKLVYLYNR